MRARHRYLLTEEIGAGGMGSVWRAWDRHERRWVAAKVLSRYDAGSLERFLREQDLRVRHRHVVQPSGRAQLGRHTLFTMDLVRGGSVADLLGRHGPLPESYVRVLLEQTLEALVAVHAAGVVHRDVKPGNLLLEPTGTGRPWLRLGDFGVASVAGDERLTRVPGAVGTGGYMAPEQAAGAPPDPRQDLYAAGVVAAQLLTGARGAAPPAGPFGSLLGRLTAVDPCVRPASATAALAALHAVGVPPDTPWRCGPRPPDVPDRWATTPPHRRPLGTSALPWWAASAASFGAALLAGGLLAGVLLR